MKFKMDAILKMEKKLGSAEKQDPKSPDDYYDLASTWRYQIYESQALWLKRALVGLVIMSVLLLLSISGYLFLLPLKESSTALIIQDKESGDITIAATVVPELLNQNWILTESSIIKYVVNREQYHLDNIDLPYQLTYAMTDDKILDDYITMVASDNEKSPYQLYGKEFYITVDVLSIEKMSDDTALIEFRQTLHERGSNRTNAVLKRAVIRWRYDSTPQSRIDALRNPLNFKVTHYRPTQTYLDKYNGD
jgi:type IV secretory pathway component VirB8